MKGHTTFLAVSVLWLAHAAWLGTAAAQTPVPAAEVAPAPAPAVPSANQSFGTPLPPPVVAPPTSVDTLSSTPVNTAPPAPPVAAPPVAAPAASAPPVAAPPSLGAPRFRDAHNDRLLFAPTAETNPRGSFYATSYYIVLLQLGYALTDYTQVSVTATPPIGDDHIVPGDISFKTVVLREPHVSVAAIASASGILGFEEFSGFLGRAGGVATFCVDASECRLAFSISTNIALAGPASVLFNGVGMSYRAGRIVSLIAELDTALPLAEPVGEANGLLGGVGVRLSGRAWGVDLGLLKAGKARTKPSDILPFLAATYRFVP